MNNTLQVLESIRNLEMKINRKYTNDFLKKVPKNYIIKHYLWIVEQKLYTI